MELFDTHFVQFDQVLAVSGQKTLAISLESVNNNTSPLLNGLGTVVILPFVGTHYI